MRTSVALAAVFVACVCVPVSGQSLAEAAEQAKAARATGQGWPASANVIPVFDADKAAAAIPAIAAPVTGDVAVVPAPPTPAATKGEAYWRGRAASLQEKLALSTAKVGPLELRIADLTTELFGIGPLNTRRGGVEAERQRLISERETLDGTVRADRAAVAGLEEAGRKAGALPGWFR